MSTAPITPPAPPSPPPAPAPTPDEAAAKLAELRGSQDWTAKFLAGNGPELAEYRKLSEIALNSGDKITKAMAGMLDDAPFQDSAHMLNIGTASMLREAGMGNDVIRQVLSGGTVTQQERDAATQVKAKLMGNADFSKRYLAGDAEAKQQMTLLNIVLSSSVQEQRA